MSRGRVRGGLLVCLLLAVGPVAAPALARTANPRASNRGHARSGSRLLGPPVQVTETSAHLEEALTPMPSLRFTAVQPAAHTIRVIPGLTYQRFRGAGGAVTDTSAWLLKVGLPARVRAWAMGELFGRGGINLNLIRVPMGASDFTAPAAPYSYDDMPSGQSDPGLAHFSVAHDQRYILPILHQALRLAVNPFVLAAPWSPPGWMKSNGRLDNTADSGHLVPSAYAPLAQYFVRFLQAYARRGVRVNAVTPQNEPGQQSTYPGLNEGPAEEGAFVHSYLAPALHRAGLHTPIYGFDAPWSGAASFAGALLRGPAAADLSGIATHCYYGSPTTMTALHEIAPKLDEIETECSPGKLPFTVPELVISSLRNWASGVELWNLALDPRGGPVQPPNYGCPRCKGLVTIDPHKHSVSFTSNFYDLGQLTRFVQPGAVRIASNNFVSYAYPKMGGNIAGPGLDDVAFRNPGGSHVLLTYDNATFPISFTVREGSSGFSYRLSPGATATFVWRPRG